MQFEKRPAGFDNWTAEDKKKYFGIIHRQHKKREKEIQDMARTQKTLPKLTPEDTRGQHLVRVVASPKEELEAMRKAFGARKKK